VRRAQRALVIAAAAASVAAAHAEPVLPFKNGAAAVPANEDEQRVWTESADFEKMLGKSGLVLDDRGLTAYLQHVADRLFPEFDGHIRLYILKSPQLNAFALPNGAIFVGEGLLARFQDESQLATVLGHEGTHFVDRHGYESIENVKSTTAFGSIASMIGTPVVGLAVDVLAVSSVTGYSRELESQADAGGYRRMVAAGYDPREAPKVFKLLMKDLEASGAKEPFFFSDHPKLQDRYDNFLKLSRETPAPKNLPPDTYRETFAALRLASLENELSMARYKQVIALLKDPEQRRDYPPYADYYLGEAYRERGQTGDAKLAQAEYLKAIGAAPDFAPPYRALGIENLKAGAYGEAIKQFETYLRLAASAADRKYVEMYLKEARKRSGTP
jgi:predicted Zn-dependent protease